MTDQDFFKTTYQTVAGQVTQCITDSTELFVASFPKDDPLRAEVVRFITTGGKRLRPVLSLVVARSLGKKDVFPHIALETFHKYLLAHDDVIDKGYVRYGQPTIHAKLASLCPQPDGQEHFGNSLAIIAGDLMESATQKIILQSDVSLQTKNALQQLIVQATEEATWGWYDQFLMDYLALGDTSLGFERIEKSILWVTGKYSIKLPLLFGYATAGIDPPQGLDRLANNLGALYQTGDDVIGLFGDVENTGKSNADDIMQGKKTIPMWLAFTNATAADKRILQQTVGNELATAEDIENVRLIVKRSGGLQRTLELMQNYRERCMGQLEQLDVPEDLRRFLRGLVMFLEERDS